MKIRRNSFGAAVVLAGLALFYHAAVIAQSSTVTGTSLNIGPTSGTYVNDLAAGVASYSGFAGGSFGEIDSTNSFIGAGFANQVSAYSSGIVAGGGNFITTSNSFIGAGVNNLIGSQLNSTVAIDSGIAAGADNTVTNYYGFIGAGYENVINGDLGFIGAGGYNTINGDYAAVGGGSYNVANGTYSAILGGTYGLAPAWGQFAHGNFRFFNPTNGSDVYGSSQASEFVLSRTTTNNTPTEIFLNGDAASQRMLLLASGTWTFDVMVTARSANGNSGGFRTNGVIKTVSGTTTFVGGATSLAVPAIASDVAGWSVSAGVGNNTLTITVTGDSSTNRWVARVHTAEVIF